LPLALKDILLPKDVYAITDKLDVVRVMYLIETAEDKLTKSMTDSALSLHSVKTLLVIDTVDPNLASALIESELPR
jgi:hypothetical protein